MWKLNHVFIIKATIIVAPRLVIASTFQQAHHTSNCNNNTIMILFQPNFFSSIHEPQRQEEKEYERTAREYVVSNTERTYIQT